MGLMFRKATLCFVAVAWLANQAASLWNQIVTFVTTTGVALALNLPGQTRLTRHGSCVGTPDYISPEQVLGREMDERSDVYALGLLLYEMLAGYPPFKSSSARETLISQVDTYPAPIAKLRGEPIPEALELYLKMMEGFDLKWSVGYMGAKSVMDTPLAQLALERGGSFRVGIEDFATGPSNLDQIQRAKELVDKVGRHVVTGPEAIKYLDIPFAATRPKG